MVLELEIGGRELSGEDLRTLGLKIELADGTNLTADKELMPVVRDLKAVRDNLKKLTPPQGTVRKQKVQEATQIEGEGSSRYVLELLKALEYYDIAQSSGRGGGWRYTGGAEIRFDRAAAVATAIATWATTGLSDSTRRNLSTTHSRPLLKSTRPQDSRHYSRYSRDSPISNC